MLLYLRGYPEFNLFNSYAEKTGIENESYLIGKAIFIFKIFYEFLLLCFCFPVYILFHFTL